jgi:hypothetical protein
MVFFKYGLGGGFRGWGGPLFKKYFRLFWFWSEFFSLFLLSHPIFIYPFVYYLLIILFFFGFFFLLKRVVYLSPLK